MQISLKYDLNKNQKWIKYNEYMKEQKAIINKDKNIKPLLN